MTLIEKLSAAGLCFYLSGGRLIVSGRLSDQQREWVRNHRDQIKAGLPVDVERHLMALAVGLPVDHTWLMSSFFTPDDLALISRGEYLAGDPEQYRVEIRKFINTMHTAYRYAPITERE